MEGRAGLFRPAFFVGASHWLLSDHARFFTSASRFQVSEMREVEHRKEHQIQALAWLDLTFLPKSISRNIRTIVQLRNDRRGYEKRRQSLRNHKITDLTQIIETTEVVELVNIY
jgi:hypothetical protein